MQIRNNKIDESTLNKYTEELLLCLPEHASQLMHQLGDDHRVPIWQVMCGIILEVHLQGNLSNFNIDPVWTEGIKQYEYVCKNCKKKFKPQNLGQVFCSNQCGEDFSLGVKHDGVDTTTTDITSDDFTKRLSHLAGKKKEGGWAKEVDIPAT